jgi:hypothetical protein
MRPRSSLVGLLALPALPVLLVASALAVGCGGSAHHARHASDGDDDDDDTEEVESLAPIKPRTDVGNGPAVDVGAFSARFPPGYAEPKRTVRKLHDGDAVAFVSSARGGVCLVLGAEQQGAREGGAKRTLRGFEKGLVGAGGKVEAASDFEYAGHPARTGMFQSRDDGGERTYWRYLAVVDGTRIFAAIFMSKREAARRAPEIEAFLGSLRVGKGPVPVAPEKPEGPPEGNGEEKI